MARAGLLLGLLLGLSPGPGRAADPGSGKHPEWPRWCGKAYQPQHPSFDPGGQTVEPPTMPGGAGLHVRFKPRYSIYLESEQEAEFVVDAAISRWHGRPLGRLEPPLVRFTIRLASGGDPLVSGEVPLGTTSNVFAFSLAGLEPRFEPYAVLLSTAGNVVAESELVLLPEKQTGSVVRLDNLDGGLLFRSRATGGRFEHFLPYGFYASCDHFLCDRDAMRKMDAYQGLGFNSLISLTPISDSRAAYEHLDSLHLRFMYDLHSAYKNLTAVREQVSAIKDFDALYSYWGSDEPDGHQDPFRLLVQARDAIRTIDPYHPVAVTLNCQNYYFGEYSAGADLIMEDAYPVAINSTWSKWGTACNATYGDCGCDNCQGGVRDVARRLDDLARHERWLGLWPKTKAHNPQSFHGEGYWSRDPTAGEAVAMSALAFHHGAKAIAAWLWPTSDALAHVHGAFARAVAREPVRDMIAGARPTAVAVAGADPLDAACWTSEREHRVLLSVVNTGHDAIDGPVTVPLPAAVDPRSRVRAVWGNATWTLGGRTLQLRGVAALSTNMLLVNTEAG